MAKHCILGEDYDETCELKLCPTKELCKRLRNERNTYQWLKVAGE